MNVRPKNYSWLEFFTHVCDLYDYAHSKKAMYRRFMSTKHMGTRIEQLFRSITSERNHKLAGNHIKMRDRLKTDKGLVRYLNGETTELPEIYIEPIRRDLKWLWAWLPEGALYHDPNVGLISEANDNLTTPEVPVEMAAAPSA